MTTVLGVLRRVKEVVLRLEGVGGLRHGVLVVGVLLLLLLHGSIDLLTLVSRRLNVADGTIWELLASMRVDDWCGLEGGRLSVLQSIGDHGSEISVVRESSLLCDFDSVGTLASN